MKHLLFFYRVVALTLVSAMFFASCKTIEEVDVFETQSVDCTVIASLGTETRTINKGNSTLWCADDAISVLHIQDGGSRYYSSRFTYSGADNEFKGKVSSLASVNNWYTVYPYSSENVSADQIKVKVLAEQVQTGNDNKSHFAGENFPLYGKELGLSNTTSISIAMKNALAGLKFKVTNTTQHPIIIKQIVMDAPVMICGDFEGDITPDEPVWTSTQTSSQQAVLKVVEGTSVAAGEVGNFYLGTIPFTAPASSSIKVKVIAVNPSAADKTITFYHVFNLANATSFMAGYEKTLNLNFDENHQKDPDDPSSAVPGYELLTSEPADWSGDYVIVSASREFLFTGSAENPNKVALSPSDFDGDVLVRTGLDAYVFNVSKSGSNYYLIKDGKYMYCSYSTDGNGETGIGLSNTPHAISFKSNMTDGTFGFWMEEGGVDQYLYYKTVNNTNFFKFGGSHGGRGVYLYKYSESASAPVVKSDQVLAFAAPTVTWTLGDTYKVGSSYDIQALTGAQTTVSYTSSNQGVAQIVNGKIRIVAAGSTTITASAAESNTYNAATASYTLTIKAAPVGVAGYQLVTSVPTDWSGKYVIVSADKAYLFTGSNTTSNLVALTSSDFSGNVIVKSGLSGYEFTISKNGNSYYLMKDGKYVYCNYSGDGDGTTGIGLSSTAQAINFNASMNNGTFGFWMQQGSYDQYLYLKSSNGSTFFKFGGSHGGNGVYLYKYTDSATVDPGTQPGTDPQPDESAKYVKVTSAPSSWDGTYLFVDETNKKAFAAFSSNASSYAVNVTISNGTIVSDGVVDKYALTVKGTGSTHANLSQPAYDIKNSEGKYIYYSSSALQIQSTNTKLNTSDSNTYTYNHGISYSNGAVQVVSSGNSNGFNKYYLQYSSGFVYSSTQGAGIQLYKLTNGTTGGGTPGTDPNPGQPGDNPGTDTPSGSVFNLENASVKSYFDAAATAYTDGNWSTTSVVTQYCSNSASNRKDTPNPVSLSWSAAAAGTKTIYIYNDAAKTKLEKSETTSGYSIDIYNLIPNRTYYYTVANSSNATVASGSFTTEGRRRMIKVSDTYGNDYANNCRDLGGMKTTDGKTLKYNLVFRGSNMSAIGNSELAVLYDYMGVRMDIDLRASGWGGGGTVAGEVSLLRNKGVGYSNAGFNSTTDLSNAQKIKTTFTDIINTVTTGNACYIHCYVGADRTGYICMLLEAVLGVSPKDCSIDYELTSFSSVGTRDRDGKHNDIYFSWGMNRIQNYSKGSTFKEKAENILLDAGITASQISAFRAAMLQ